MIRRNFSFLEYINPDFIIGTETWLSRDDYSSQFFPENFMVYQAYRPATTKGGVLIAIKSTLMGHQVTM